MGRLIKSEKCICGKEGVFPIPKGIDDFIEIVDGEKPFEWSMIDYTKLCKDCLERVNQLMKRFNPSFYPDLVCVTYDRKHDILVVKASNEYGDKASLSERRKTTVSSVKNLWTGEVVILEDGEITEVI